jgi:hypothetical protein
MKSKSATNNPTIGLVRRRPPSHVCFTPGSNPLRRMVAQTKEEEARRDALAQRALALAEKQAENDAIHAKAHLKSSEAHLKAVTTSESAMALINDSEAKRDENKIAITASARKVAKAKTTTPLPKQSLFSSFGTPQRKQAPVIGGFGDEDSKEKSVVAKMKVLGVDSVAKEDRAAEANGVKLDLASEEEVIAPADFRELAENLKKMSADDLKGFMASQPDEGKSFFLKVMDVKTIKHYLTVEVIETFSPTALQAVLTECNNKGMLVNQKSPLGKKQLDALCSMVARQFEGSFKAPTTKPKCVAYLVQYGLATNHA